MTLGEKLARLRRENNYTQEQLAQCLEVSRQSVSKWESDLTYPETEKLIRLCQLFDCSLDYLVRDIPEPGGASKAQEPGSVFRQPFSLRERKSQRIIWGIPLWHVGRNAHGVIAVGLKARGVIAVGVAARGLVSCGVFSLGVISFGAFALGLLAVGMFALGLLAFGSIAAGIFAAGAVSLGIISLGAAAFGDFSVGAFAMGKYFAMGDSARGMIALGDSAAAGTLFQKLGDLSAGEVQTVHQLLEEAVPGWLSWAAHLIELFL